MAYQNNCAFVGRLGQDPVVNETGGENSIKVANFSIAVNEVRGTGDNRKEITNWVRCVAFRGQAKTVESFTRKGSRVGVQGRLQNREWIDKENQKRLTTEIVLDSLCLLDPVGSKGQSENPPADEFAGAKAVPKKTAPAIEQMTDAQLEEQLS
jgi:single-strand DNA-binding protein